LPEKLRRVGVARRSGLMAESVVYGDERNSVIGKGGASSIK
jgi:hypothetical protein